MHIFRKIPEKALMYTGGDEVDEYSLGFNTCLDQLEAERVEIDVKKLSSFLKPYIPVYYEKQADFLAKEILSAINNGEIFK
jgi:hypothetical protein